jgi:hypothetical protein
MTLYMSCFTGNVLRKTSAEGELELLNCGGSALGLFWFVSVRGGIKRDS